MPATEFKTANMKKSIINAAMCGVSEYEIRHLVGKKVAKVSGKKFKSGNLENTIVGVVEHPELGIPAFAFAEDDSIVEARRCEVVSHGVMRKIVNILVSCRR